MSSAVLRLLLPARSHALSGQDLFVVVLLLLALVAAVVLTAIWSRDKDRRKDARDVLGRIIRWLVTQNARGSTAG
jgi:hypothetical protein